MVRFGMDINLTDEELRSIGAIFQPVDRVLILTNDYYSYDREFATAQRTGAGRIVNAVEMLMRTRNLPLDQAKKTIKDLIIADEQEYVARKKAFYEQCSTVSITLRRWVEVAGTVMAGNHYWSSHCPRYHAFAKHEASPEVSDNSCRASESSRASTASRDTSPSLSDRNLSLKQTAMRTLRYPSPAKVEAAHSTLSLAGTSAWPEPDRSVILQPCSYISTMPSKGVRSQLIDALNDWFHVPKASLDTISEIIRQLHDASLILDDIEDNSPLRRRKPAVYSIYGHSQAINSANYMFVRAVQASRQLRSSSATDILLEDLDGLCVGQSLDLNWKFTLHCPTEEEYLTMIDHKTGGMFRMLLRLMKAESRYHAKVDFGREIHAER